MKTHLTLLGLVLSLTGCSDRALDAGASADGGLQPQTGAYEVWSKMISDTCQPVADPVHRHQVLIQQQPPILSVGLPEFLPGPAWILEYPISLRDGRAAWQEPICGATQQLSLEVLDRQSASLTVRETVTWTNVASSTPA